MRVQTFTLIIATLVLASCAPAPPPAAQLPAAEPTSVQQPATAQPAAEPTNTQQPAAAQPAADLSGEITAMSWNVSPENDKVLQDQVAAFEQSHPGTKISLTLLPYDQYNQKLALLFSSGTPPDSFAMPADIMRYVQEGHVLPLDEYMNADPVLSDKAQSRTEANDLVRLDGEHVYVAQYGPLCSEQLYFNKDLFDKAGLSYPDENWTWDDFLAAAQKLTVRDGDETTQWGVDLGYMGGWDGGWQSLMWSRGGTLADTNFNPTELNLNSPEAIDAFQWLQDLVYKYEVAPPPAVAKSLQQAGGPFLSGRVGMVVDGCWMLSAYKGGNFELGMTLIPKGPAGRVGPIWYAMTFVIAKASKNPELAWEWSRWLAVDEKANELQASTGQSCGAPIVRKYDEMYSAAWKDVPGGEACVKSLDNTKFGQIYAANWQEIWDTIIAPEWDKLMNGTQSAEEFTAAISEKVNQKLQE